MRIAFVISSSFCVSPYNGIRAQAQIWADELIRQGHQVIKVNPWERQEWETYDVIHLFGHSSLLNIISRINNPNIFLSPIIDSFKPVWAYRLATMWGFDRLRLSSHNHDFRNAKAYVRKWCVRTKFEADYVHRGYDVPLEDIVTVPLSYRFQPLDKVPQKENFCLHVSNITASRKNVMRLIDAAIKYKFKLVLAGSADACFQNSLMKKKIDGNANITYIGRVSDEKLKELYGAAKVFALPSIGEGVGLVALDAAVYGCDIVVTSIGGPKEYYDGLAFEVDPYSVDSIGAAVMSAMSAKDRQPRLMRHVIDSYGLSQCMHKLADSYVTSSVNG